MVVGRVGVAWSSWYPFLLNVISKKKKRVEGISSSPPGIEDELVELELELELEVTVTSQNTFLALMSNRIS